jgi:hypothetical protein
MACPGPHGCGSDEPVLLYTKSPKVCLGCGERSCSKEAFSHCQPACHTHCAYGARLNDKTNRVPLFESRGLLACPCK